MLHLHWLLAAFGNRVSIHVAYGADCESDEEEKLMVRDISCRISFILFQFQAQFLRHLQSQPCAVGTIHL